MGKGGKSNGDVAEVKNAAEEENMAAWLVSINSLKILPFKLPALGPHDVKVTMKAVGICGSDVHLLKTLKLCDYVAKEPMVIGHECAGIVAEVGSEVKSLVPGDRVALEPGISCWRCQQCKEGSYNLCPDMKCFATPPVHGSLANQVVHPADLCFKLPDNLTLEEGAMCEPLSVAVHACRRANIGSETNVLVMGAGPIGLVAMLAARAFGAPRIVIVDVDDYRLSVAKKLGADEIVNVSTNTQQNMMQVVTQPPHANPHRPNVEFPVHLPPPPPPPLAEAVHPPPPPPPPPAAAGHASVLAVRHQNIANPIEPVVTEVVVGADGQVISRFYNLLTHQRYQYRLDLVLAERRNQWRGLRGRVGPFMSEWHFNRHDGVLNPTMEGARLTSGILRGYSVFREKHTHHGNLRDLSCFYFNILTTQGYEDEYEVFIVPSSGPRVTNVAAFGVVADRIALCSILFGEVLESIDASISGLNPAQDPPRTYQPEMRDLYDLLGGINVANGSALAMELSNHCGLWSETKKKTYCLTYELLRRCHQSVVEASVELFKVHESYADPTVPNWHYLAEIDQGVLNKVLMYPPGLCTTWYADPWGTLYQATNHRYVHSAVSFLSFVCNVFKHDPLGSHDAETEFILSKNYPLYIVKLVKALNDTGLKSH